MTRWPGNTMLLWGLGMLCTLPGQADTIELANGDILSGQVISLDGKQLILKSEVLGEVKLDRKKISSIYLGEKPVRPKLPTPEAKPLLDPKVQNVLGNVPSSEDVIKQLQSGGVNQQMIGAIQTKFPLLNTPEAGGYFNDTITGLMTGKMGIQDVRKDAVKARDELKKLQDELGPDGAALNGYMSILNKFINETDPAAPEKPRLKKPTDKKDTPAQFPPKPKTP